MTAVGPRAGLPQTAHRDLAECIVAVARGHDHDAFAFLFTHFAPRVKTYFRRRGASVALAEDLAQETLLAVWHKAFLFDPAKAGAATWVFTIARNLRLDALRRERYPTAEECSAPAHCPPDGDQLTAQVEWERLVAEALAHLPAEQADLVRRSFFADKSHTEIERELELPLGTVKSRLRAAMRSLRLTLGKTM